MSDEPNLATPEAGYTSRDSRKGQAELCTGWRPCHFPYSLIPFFKTLFLAFSPSFFIPCLMMAMIMMIRVVVTSERQHIQKGVD